MAPDDDDVKSHPYRTREGIKQWMLECGIGTYREAMECLGCERRTWFRWQQKGLPPGLYGDLVVRAMLDIKRQRSVPRIKVMG